MRDFHIEKQIKCLLREKDCEVACHRALPSTNALAKEALPAQTARFALYIAGRQTQGRGRLGRSFYSPGGGIYLTLAIRELETERTPDALTCAAAVAVAKAVRTVCSFLPGIKWVNDLLLPNGKKFCGILCERTPAGLVMGVGVNAARCKFPAELREIAGTLGLRRKQRRRLTAEIAQELLRVFCEPKKKIMEIYREQNIYLGKEILFYQYGVACSGVAERIDEDGALIVRLSDGKLHHLHTGEVSIRKM
ncbi:MAG: biotin--[acetyl-CoA-carboxylase] ligase [Clostridiales bacterium]|nr:biotin--[acetyl-CoA-carboxylase] ligase [Clostridiales bacterium]